MKPEHPARGRRCQPAPVTIANPARRVKYAAMTDIAKIALTLDRNERAALASLPVPDMGYLDEETWWLFYSLLDQGLLTGGDDRMMRRTDLGEAVLQHIKACGAE